MDRLEEYFKCYDSDSEVELTSPCLINLKKRKRSFADYREDKLQYSSSAAALDSTKLAAHWCCKLLCYSWLPTNLVLYCRGKYLLIETSKGRREWFEERLKEMETFEKRFVYVYYLDSPDGHRKRCCHAAWDFSYGVSRATRENASGGERTLPSTHKSSQMPSLTTETALRTDRCLWFHGSNNLPKNVAIFFPLAIET
jgi:hypothetical protein